MPVRTCNNPKMKTALEGQNMQELPFLSHQVCLRLSGKSYFLKIEIDELYRVKLVLAHLPAKKKS